MQRGLTLIEFQDRNLMSYPDTGALRADERAYISALLSRYPGLADDELDELKNWFDRAATPLELGLLASDPAIAPQYRQFRAEHFDRLGKSDMLQAACFAAAFLGLALVIVLQTP